MLGEVDLAALEKLRSDVLRSKMRCEEACEDLSKKADSLVRVVAQVLEQVQQAKKAGEADADAGTDQTDPAAQPPRQADRKSEPCRRPPFLHAQQRSSFSPARSPPPECARREGTTSPPPLCDADTVARRYLLVAHYHKPYSNNSSSSLLSVEKGSPKSSSTNSGNLNHSPAPTSPPVPGAIVTRKPLSCFKYRPAEQLELLRPVVCSAPVPVPHACSADSGFPRAHSPDSQLSPFAREPHLGAMSDDQQSPLDPDFGPRHESLISLTMKQQSTACNSPRMPPRNIREDSVSSFGSSNIHLRSCIRSPLRKASEGETLVSPRQQRLYQCEAFRKKYHAGSQIDFSAPRASASATAS
eukprot:gene11103-17069_t